MIGECHAHIMLDGQNYKKAGERHLGAVDDAYIRGVLREYKRRGVNFIRDGGDNLGVSERAKILAPEYGIEYATPVFAIYKYGNYGSIVGFPYKDYQDYKNLVAKAAAHKADFIKLMVTGILDFNSFGSVSEGAISYEELRYLINYAHDNNLAVMAHVNKAEHIIDAAKAGADSIEHGFYQSIESIAAMKEYKTVWVPTLSAVRNLIDDAKFSKDALSQIISEHQAYIRKAVEAGCMVALGSDAGAYRVMHAQGAFDEYEALTLTVKDGAPLEQKLKESEEVIKNKFLLRKGI